MSKPQLFPGALSRSAFLDAYRGAMPDRSGTLPPGAQLTGFVERELEPSEIARLDEVVRVGSDRAADGARTLSAAFFDDPFFQWMSRGLDDNRRTEMGPRLWELALRRPDRGTEVLSTLGAVGVAIWEPPIGSVPADSGDDDYGYQYYDLYTAYVGAEQTREVFSFLAQMHETRPPEPHWYLSVLGVAPEAQGRGWGARLIEPVLARCDEMGLHAHLESSNPRNHSFYLRHGFVRSGELPAPGGPELALFTRQPRS